MSRIPLIAGNWKMNKTAGQAGDYCRALKKLEPDRLPAELVVFPPYTALPAVAENLAGTTVRWGGQDLHWELSGPFTGAVSGQFLAELGCSYVIVGHSERRNIFGEADSVCARKIAAARKTGLIPVFCCGESDVERSQGSTFSVLERQLSAVTPADFAGETVIAYEPVWAIGTGNTATADQIVGVHQWLRRWLTVHHGTDVAERTRLLYGGSVTPAVAAELLALPDVDGLLVGGASLQPEAFFKIAEVGSASFLEARRLS